MVIVIVEKIDFISLGRLPEAVITSLGDKPADGLQKLLKQFNETHDVSKLQNLRSHSSSPASSAAGGQPQPPQNNSTRTLCEPTFVAPNVPLKMSLQGVPSEVIPLVDFQSKECLSMSQYKFFVMFVCQRFQVRGGAA